MKKEMEEVSEGQLRQLGLHVYSKGRRKLLSGSKWRNHPE